MSQTNQSLKNEAWTGLSGPLSHIFPWLGSNRVGINHLQGSQDTGTAGTGDVHGVSTVMATIDAASVGAQIISVGTLLDVYSSANYNDIEGWAPRIFLKDPDAANDGLYPGQLNLPWAASNNGRVLPFNFGSVGNNGSQNSTGIGFVLENQGGTDTYTAYGYTSSPNPYLQACINRPYFQGIAGSPITWKVKVRCCRYYNIGLTHVQNNTPDLFDDDQGETSNVDVFLFGTDTNGSYDGSGLGTGYSVGSSTTATSPAYSTGVSFYYKSNTNVPFLWEGYGGDGNDFGSAVNILSNVTDGTAGGYAYRTQFGQRVDVPAVQHQAQYDGLINQIHNTGWTEIEFYCQFDSALYTLDGLQIRVDNNTPNSSVLFDYISLQPLNISPANCYGGAFFSNWPSPFAFANPDNGGLIFTTGISTGAVSTMNNFSFDTELD